MSVFVVAVLMAGLGFYWGLQRRGAGTARPGVAKLLLPLAVYCIAVAVLFVPIAGTECVSIGSPVFAKCELAKRAEVSAYLIVAAGALAASAGAWFGGYKRARLWLLALWPLPLLLGWALS